MPCILAVHHENVLLWGVNHCTGHSVIPFLLSEQFCTILSLSILLLQGINKLVLCI